MALNSNGDAIISLSLGCDHKNMAANGEKIELADVNATESLYYGFNKTSVEELCKIS